MASSLYHYQNKNYPHLKEAYRIFAESSSADLKLANDFLVFSNEVLLTNSSAGNVHSLKNWEALMQHPPKSMDIFIYNFYKHAYPLEQEDWDGLQHALQQRNYRSTLLSQDKWVEIWRFENP
ncbi:hypothetical protein GCM10008106_01180 [Mongoliitalea lutea]|uniref:Uncharacterized protein n=2 Tax=Mongoliitalea lutea TaxID=849756 RepID=A0A8J3CVP8_9BACT|nr:hypothetical protein GCM10008106_01180 [Mongoliitalea lutea]